MVINKFNLNNSGRPYLIAEAGSAHDGNPEIARQLTEAAIESGADALTFQEIDETKLYSELKDLPVSRQYRVGWDCLAQCRQIARNAGLAFSVCVTDLDSLAQAVVLGVDFIKIVSYDITFLPFLTECGKTALPILLSTGASTFPEIEVAIDTLRAPGRVLLYHTDCGYPTGDSEVNLLRMLNLKEKFKTPVGYCDHTDHGLSCLAAAALGADAIEKHLTMDGSLSVSDDHIVSMKLPNLKSLFGSIKRIATIRGTGSDKIMQGDLFRRNNLRRSIALKNAVKTGATLALEDLTMLRPPIGLPWEAVDQFIGKKVVRDLPPRHILSLTDVA